MDLTDHEQNAPRPPGCQLITGDARDIPLEDESVQMCVTSPPYWGLRDYGVEDQLGLEPTPEEYVQNLVEAFREVKRVLRPDGTFWLNIGDSYASDKGGTTPPENSWEAHDSSNRGARDQQSGNVSNRRASNVGLKGKDLVGIPWRVAFALQEDGWWLRSDIIWKKGNCMPESVTDRPTSSHEHIFLFAKNKQYYYDHEAIKEPLETDKKENYPQRAEVTGRGDQDYAEARGGDRGKSGGFPINGRGKNKRDVWEVNPKPFPDAHFAVYPPELIRPCVRAGTSKKGGCEKCGAPYERVVETDPMEIDRSDRGEEMGGPRGRTQASGTMKSPSTSQTVGWDPTCDHDADVEPQIVFDPFSGAGTTGVVALQEGRRFIGMDLNEDYHEMATKRLHEEWRENL